MSHTPVEEYSRGQYSKHSAREESWPTDAKISLKAKVITWQGCYCVSVFHSCCHSGEEWLWWHGNTASVLDTATELLQVADSSTYQQCQNWSEKLFHYRNRRCDLKIVLLWVYELNSCYWSVKKPCYLGILEGRRNYKHGILGFVGVF